jgi:rSAM/selenodomain-associated transferase 2
MRLAVIVPVLNEADTVGEALARLQPLRKRGASVIVVDGSSTDATAERARAGADCVLDAPRGRAVQMNRGAEVALRDDAVEALLFLHADTRLPDRADESIAAAIRDRSMAWGRFDVRIAGEAAGLRLVGTLMNLRSRLTGICTGDQCLFATRQLFEALGGFSPIPLMEDIDFSRRARRLARPRALREVATTSGRRWDRHGVARTVVLMWRLRLAYYLGADPARLADDYRDAR